MKEWLKKMAQELGLPETAPEAEILAKLGERVLSTGAEASAVQTKLSSVAAQLAAHGLTVDLSGKEPQVVKAAPKVTGDPADKARIAQLELDNAKQKLSAAKTEVDAILKAGKVPPAVKDQLNRVFSSTGKLESLQLGKDGAGSEVIIKGTIDVLADLKAIFDALPGVSGAGLSRMTALAGDAGTPEAQRLATKAKASAVAARVQGRKPEKAAGK